MQWLRLKAELLSCGTTSLTGEPAENYIAISKAGPGANNSGALFFSPDTEKGTHKRRVRLSLNPDPDSPVKITHHGNGTATLTYKTETVKGKLEPPALHCPEQAYIAVTTSCIFSCRYCTVSKLSGRKSIDETEKMIEKVLPDIKAISLTSGVLETVKEEEDYIVKLVKRLSRFCLPIGVSIYPTKESPGRLKEVGATEVKFNLEAATDSLFKDVCPGLDSELILEVLKDSVKIFGKNRVFSNIIFGLGETDTELETCMRKLAEIGVIPVTRPLEPAGSLSHYKRPTADRLERVCLKLDEIIKEAGLDTTVAQTMCPECTGCDLIPGRDT